MLRNTTFNNTGLLLFTLAFCAVNLLNPEAAFAGGLEKFINPGAGKKVFQDIMKEIDTYFPAITFITAIAGAIIAPGDLRTKAVGAGMGSAVALAVYAILGHMVKV